MYNIIERVLDAVDTRAGWFILGALFAFVAALLGFYYESQVFIIADALR